MWRSRPKRSGMPTYFQHFFDQRFSQPLPPSVELLTHQSRWPPGQAGEVHGLKGQLTTTRSVRLHRAPPSHLWNFYLRGKWLAVANRGQNTWMFRADQNTWQTFDLQPARLTTSVSCPTPSQARQNDLRRWCRWSASQNRKRAQQMNWHFTCERSCLCATWAIACVENSTAYHQVLSVHHTPRRIHRGSLAIFPQLGILEARNEMQLELATSDFTVGWPGATIVHGKAGALDSDFWAKSSWYRWSFWEVWILKC